MPGTISEKPNPVKEPENRFCGSQFKGMAGSPKQPRPSAQSLTWALGLLRSRALSSR